jgi:hypothetical protein
LTQLHEFKTHPALGYLCFVLASFIMSQPRFVGMLYYSHKALFFYKRLIVRFMVPRCVGSFECERVVLKRKRRASIVVEINLYCFVS